DRPRGQDAGGRTPRPVRSRRARRTRRPRVLRPEAAPTRPGSQPGPLADGALPGRPHPPARPGRPPPRLRAHPRAGRHRHRCPAPWARDAAVLPRRILLHWRQRPVSIVLALLFPVLIVLMFGYLFGGAMAVPDGTYTDYLIPGMLAMTMLFGLESMVLAVTTDA